MSVRGAKATADQRQELIEALDAASAALARLAKALHAVPLPKVAHWCTDKIPLCMGRAVGNGCTCDYRRDRALTSDLVDLATAIVAALEPRL